MKRKAVLALFAGGAACAAVAGGPLGGMVHAQTWGSSWEGKNGTINRYVTESGSFETSVDEYISEKAADGEFSRAEVAGTVLQVMSEEEQQRLEQWGRIELQESLAYLKEYGVAYDTEQDAIMYRGKKVRWLIDDRMDHSRTSYQMPDGEIDLYTERDANYRVTGVRTATQEEYDRRTKQDELAETRLADAGVTITYVGETGECVQEDAVCKYRLTDPDGTIKYTFQIADQEDKDGYTFQVKENGDMYTYHADRDAVLDFAQAVEEESEDMTEDVLYGRQVQSETEVMGYDSVIQVEKKGADREDEVQPQTERMISVSAEAEESTVAEGNASGWLEDNRRREEYRAAGIDCDDRNGAWTWNGKAVYWLVDEDGSMYQNGSAAEDKIYVLVKRDTDGTILEAKQITVEEVIAAHILEKEQKKETQR